MQKLENLSRSLDSINDNTDVEKFLEDPNGLLGSWSIQLDCDYHVQ